MELPPADHGPTSAKKKPNAYRERVDQLNAIRSDAEFAKQNNLA
jgi:hypothetical protein